MLDSIALEALAEKQAEIFRLERALAYAVEALGGRLVIDHDEPLPCLLINDDVYETRPGVKQGNHTVYGGAVLTAAEIAQLDKFPAVTGTDLGKSFDDPPDSDQFPTMPHSH